LRPDTDEYEILKRQVQSFKPDILYVDDSYILGDRVEDLLNSVPDLKISLGRCGSAMTDRAKSQIRYYTHVIGVSLHFVNILQDMGLKSFEVKQGFEDTLLPVLRPETFPESCDVLFCGSFYAMEGGHHLRMSIFWDLVDLPCDFVIRTGTLKPRPILMALSDNKFPLPQYPDFAYALQNLASVWKSSEWPAPVQHRIFLIGSYRIGTGPPQHFCKEH